MSGRGSAWTDAATVAGFVHSPPNETLLRFAASERERCGEGVLLDIGCGAGRNLLPLVDQGWRAIGVDSSAPMLTAAQARLRADLHAATRAALVLSNMDAVPVRGRSANLIVAHGVWNLATSDEEFRRAVREAARVARINAGLFVFTFSRNTLMSDAQPVVGQTFVYTAFSGHRQCFLSDEQLVSELGVAGFEPAPEVPLREHNVRARALQVRGGPPVIYEAAFRYRAR